MAKRRMLQWMRERLHAHADKVVMPAVEKRALDAAYKKAAPRVLAIVHKKFPPAEMKVLGKWGSAAVRTEATLQYPTGAVVKFVFLDDEKFDCPQTYEYRSQMYLADGATATAVDAWLSAKEAFDAERKKRLTAYKAL